MYFEKMKEQGVDFYIVPTPIGNLEDMTYRAVSVLKDVEVIFSEDTRVTSLLLKHFDIKKKLISSHSYNESNNYNKLRLVSEKDENSKFGTITKDLIKSCQ